MGQVLHTHDQLRSHLSDFVNAYNFGRRSKTLKGVTPNEAICKAWTAEPKRFTRDPLHQMPGLTIEKDQARRSATADLIRLHPSFSISSEVAIDIRKYGDNP